MEPGGSEWELPSGSRVVVGPSAVIGRGPTAQLRLDDPRVSTVHAELSWRPEGLTLLARGGRLRVGGRGVQRVRVEPGLSVELAPGLALRALAVAPAADQVVPHTDGRQARRILVASTSIVAFGPHLPPEGCVVGGVTGHLLARVLRAGVVGEPWETLAAAMWPEDAQIRATSAWTDVDERRLRNRFDQHLRGVRTQLERLEIPAQVELAGGVVRALPSPDLVIEPA